MLAKNQSRAPMGWLLELLSLPMYSRPSLSLLQAVRPDQSPVHIGIVALVDWLHMLFLLLVTVTLLLMTFRWRERQWLERV